MQMTLIASGKMSWTVLRITIPPEPEENEEWRPQLGSSPAPPQIVRRNCLARFSRKAIPARSHDRGTFLVLTIRFGLIRPHTGRRGNNDVCGDVFSAIQFEVHGGLRSHT